MTPEAAIRELQGLAHDHKAAHGYLAPYPQQWRNVEAHADTLSEIARLIEALQSERDALAEQVRVMREALIEAHGRLAIASVDLAHGLKPYAEGIEEAERTCIKALALPPLPCERQASVNGKKGSSND